MERALGIDGESSASQKSAICLTSRDICFRTREIYALLVRDHIHTLLDLPINSKMLLCFWTDNSLSRSYGVGPLPYHSGNPHLCAKPMQICVNIKLCTLRTDIRFSIFAFSGIGGR